MDENIIQAISSFLSKWGFWQLVAIVSIVVLTLIVKIPIKKGAEKYQAKTGVDKSAITWVITLIPFVFAFVAALLLDLLTKSWDVDLIDWAEVVKQCSVLGTASIGLFEAVKKYGEAFAAKKVAASKAPSEPKSEAPVQEAKVITINKSPDEKGKKDVIKL